MLEKEVAENIDFLLDTLFSVVLGWLAKSTLGAKLIWGFVLFYAR